MIEVSVLHLVLLLKRPEQWMMQHYLPVQWKGLLFVESMAMSNRKFLELLKDELVLERV